MVHHSVSEKHYGKNYGSLFIFWDRIFNTYQPPVPVAEIGLPGSGFNERGFLYDFWYGYMNVWRRVGESFRVARAPISKAGKGDQAET